MLYRFKSYFDYLSGKSTDVKFFVIIIMIALIIDMEISNAAHLIDERISSDTGIIIFILVSFIYLLSQQYILSYSIKKPFQIQVESYSFKIIQRMINIMIYFIVVCFLTIIIEILISEYYDSFFLLLILVITNSISIIMMSNISIKFFSWYQSRRHLTILVYGVMSGTIAVTAFASILFMGTILIGQPEKIDSGINVVIPSFEQGSVLSVLNYFYYYLAILSYVITWIITSLLLKDYANKLGKSKYWIILSLPLLFYLSQLLVTQFGLFISEEGTEQFSFQIWLLFFYTLSSPIGGILFSLPFFLVIKKINTGKPLENYLKISAYGLILYFAAGSATVYHTPYPPFGLSTVAVIGPSSYLIAIGIYYSTRLIARNRIIENQMRKSEKYSQFLANIGSAEMERAMTEIIEEVRKKLPSDRDDIQPDSDSIDKEILEYLKKFQSTKKKKSNPSDSNNL